MSELKIEINNIYNMDCLEGLKLIPDNTIDLILTSPPYDNIEGSGYGKVKKDVLFLKLYSEFMNNILKEMKRILKPTGQIFINLKHSTINKKLKTCHWFEFLEHFQELEFKSYIIWKYSGSFDSTFKRFHLDYEIIYHLSKTEDIRFNLEGNDPLTSVWYVPHNIKSRLHPVQMPEALASKIIKIASNENDTVLDCFMGSGTTAVVSKQLNRNYIGFELDDKYVQIAKKRLKQEKLK